MYASVFLAWYDMYVQRLRNSVFSVSLIKCPQTKTTSHSQSAVRLKNHLNIALREIIGE